MSTATAEVPSDAGGSGRREPLAHRSKAERAATGTAARADDCAALHDAIESGRIAAETGL